MRISHNAVLTTSSGLFSKIIVIPASGAQMSLIIMVGYRGSNLQNDASMALQAMQDPKQTENVWLPQFKLEHSSVTSKLRSLTKEPLPNARQFLKLHLYAAPLSDGTIQFEPDSGSTVVSEPFVVAVTSTQLSSLLEVPLMVMDVPQTAWKTV